MMKKMFIFVCCISLAFLFLSPMPSNAAPKVVKLVFSSPWRPPPSNLGAAVDRFMNELERQTNGRVKFEKHWGGSMTTGPESLEALKSGVIDFGGMAWLYNPAMTPLGMVPFAVPFGSQDVSVVNQCMRECYQKVPAFQEEMRRNNIVPIIWYTMLPATVFTKFPVNSLDDLKGRKMGAGGTHFPKYLKAVGATGVNILSPETYMALQKNVIEGHLIPLDIVDDQKVYEVVSYATEAVFSPITCNIWGFNSRSFNRLPKDIQQLAFQLGGEMNYWTCGLIKEREKTIKAKWIKYGVKFSELSDADKRKWVKAMYYIPGEWAKKMESKGLPGWEMIETYCQCMKDKGHEFPPDWELSKKFK